MLMCSLKPWEIALHDADGMKFPNLALMKLSAYYKKRGDNVSWYDPIFSMKFEKIYSSKVFTFTKTEKPINENDYIFYGGTGYKSFENLDDDIEHTCPDYDLYGIDYSMGFLTRGCPNKCSWCIVPLKEGNIRKHADIEEFLKHDRAILLDNNVLAHNHGIEQIEKIAKLGIKIDFNQGLDARLIDNNIARKLSKCKWLHPIRLACDQKSQMEFVQKAITNLRWHNATPRLYFVYVLVKDIEDALERIRFLKGLDVVVYASNYRDYNNKIKITSQQKELARWANRRWIFRKCTWEDYNSSIRAGNALSMKTLPDGG